MHGFEYVPIDASTPLGRASIRMLNRARRMGTGVRDLVGEPIQIARCPAGGIVFINLTAGEPRVTWQCRNWSIAEALAYLRDPSAHEPAGWRAVITERIEAWSAGGA